MSLVSSAEPSSTSCRKLYSLKGSSDSSALSTPAFSPDNHKMMYTTDSYSSESYEKYILDSPTEELIHPSSSAVSGNSLNPQGASSYQLRVGSSFPMAAQKPLSSSCMSMRHDAYQSNFEVDYLESQSPVPIEYDEDTMRLKLEELERALLDDNEMLAAGQSMEIDGEWSDPVQNVPFRDSPKESSSTDSNLSSICSSKEVSQITPRTPKQLLIDCAAALSEGNIEEATAIIKELRQMVSIQGDPPQRIAAYMVEGLAARMAASGKFLYKSLKCKEPPSSDRLAAMQILFEVCPCFKFGFMAANGAIIEAFKDEKRVHIIDFDINQGSQYITLIQTIASRPGKRPLLRLTGVDDPESVQRSVGGLQIIGLRLEKLAEALGVPFKFHAVPSKTSFVTPSMLDHRPGEALVVNFAFQLHHMPDESVSTVNQRDQLLRMVKSLNPKLVTVVEQDVNTNTAPFFPRFMEAYNYYSAVFESLDVTLPRESQDRMNVERQCLARDIVNIVACEGEERIERYEVAGKWRARMTMAGFTSRPMSSNVKDMIQKLIKEYCDRYRMKEEMGLLHFGWEDKSLIVASAWT
ncbi:scarecrow-like protein 1 isoform X1 [Pistacia vera]|uniref:scarecrow-like protein 1 isoform X1 n=1 Tax=Pistacia vera TaxID=55513 RepID=UPI0012635704|nr:scarecrow-like protein 1 isoform X1 [Pistacia vera]XP_031248532.1 scarecrow-like protein 1 isoform X1 [Pistacia vera]XP_031248533.1 scarecrow-like protein 1 isoform X1 [Pistacia vera]XP_031248534.1 scarecrow-like protein 1 isoform X1 [Pistacia vera]XP_031248535.1 scarecrow-like protein 1 isoform X1 [Pistacia vera]